MMSIPAGPAATETTFVPRLPVELWLRIFRFATSAPISVHYESFQSSHDNTALMDAALRDRYTLTLVCKQWGLLADDILYEDIRVGRGLAALYAALDQPTDTDTADHLRAPRHRVLRLVLPYLYTATPTCHWQSPPALLLLALLTHLEVLVRPPIPPTHSPIFEFPTTVPPLPTLRRLEWAFDPSGAATRTGGINTLADVLCAAPALEVLVLVGSMPFTALYQRRLPPLKRLTMLRLQEGAGTCPLVTRQMTYWALPALENVVVEGPARAEVLEVLWETFGGQVRVLELELELGNLVPVYEVQRIIGGCPALQVLNLRVPRRRQFALAPRRDSDDDTAAVVSVSPWCRYAHQTLRRVGLCVDGDARGWEWDISTWMAVGEYVGQFGEGCPAMREVVLYVQNVRVAAQSPQYHKLHETLSSSGRQLLLHPLHA
jgi:F-box-like